MELLKPTNENLMSPKATKPLTEWLIHAARYNRTITYGQAKGKLEGECGFSTIPNQRMGIVAGATMNAILKKVPNAPLLNVLLVQTKTNLPGAGVVGYLADRYPNRSWLRADNAHEHKLWRKLVEDEATKVYGYNGWIEVYKRVYGSKLPTVDDHLTGKERDGTGTAGGGGGEGPNHKKLRLKVTRKPSLVRRGLRAENTDTEVELLSGDRVDVVSKTKDRVIAIEVKSRDSNHVDLRRGVYQCVKYKAVLEAQDIRNNPTVESWLVTETKLPGELLSLTRRLRVKTKVIQHG